MRRMGKNADQLQFQRQIAMSYLLRFQNPLKSPLARNLLSNLVNMMHIMIKYSISYNLLQTEEGEDVVKKCVVHKCVHNSPNVMKVYAFHAFRNFIFDNF